MEYVCFFAMDFVLTVKLLDRMDRSLCDYYLNFWFLAISMKKKLRKLHVFLVTMLLGGAIMSYKLFEGNFSGESFHEWALDSLLVAAIIGFIAVKWLKRKGQID